MENQILRKIFLAFIQIHILHHAVEEPIYGSWMMEELSHHGYTVSAGTLYPILHSMEENGLLTVTSRNVGGKIRKYYRATEAGETVLREAKAKIRELTGEL